jgi:hypothetical protein
LLVAEATRLTLNLAPSLRHDGHHTMKNLSPLKTGAAIGIAAVVLALPGRVTTASATSAHAATVFAWPGVYDLVGAGFPDGPRDAVMYIGKEDTTYSLVSLKGPPGTLVSFKVAAGRGRGRKPIVPVMSDEFVVLRHRSSVSRPKHPELGALH